MSVSSHTYGGAIPPEFTPVFCAAIDVWRVLDALEGVPMDGRSDRPEAPTLVSGQPHLL